MISIDCDSPPFWLVWRENGGSPTVKHSTFNKAKAEAERLARACPGQQFFILCPVAAAVKDAVQWQEFVCLEDSIPF